MWGRSGQTQIGTAKFSARRPVWAKIGAVSRHSFQKEIKIVKWKFRPGSRAGYTSVCSEQTTWHKHLHFTLVQTHYNKYTRVTIGSVANPHITRNPSALENVKILSVEPALVIYLVWHQMYTLYTVIVLLRSSPPLPPLTNTHTHTHIGNG